MSALGVALVAVVACGVVALVVWLVAGRLRERRERRFSERAARLQARSAREGVFSEAVAAGLARGAGAWAWCTHELVAGRERVPGHVHAARRGAAERVRGGGARIVSGLGQRLPPVLHRVKGALPWDEALLPGGLLALLAAGLLFSVGLLVAGTVVFAVAVLMHGVYADVLRRRPGGSAARHAALARSLVSTQGLRAGRAVTASAVRLGTGVAARARTAWIDTRRTSRLRQLGEAVYARDEERARELLAGLRHLDEQRAGSWRGRVGQRRGTAGSPADIG